MRFNNISFPVLLDTWRIQNGGNDMEAYYHEWNNDDNEPYAGGFGLVVFNRGNGTNTWRIWWIGSGELALKADDNNAAYAGIRTGYDSGYLALTDGSNYSNQNTLKGYDPQGRFTIENHGNGDIAIKHNGNPISFRYDNRWNDWSFNVITQISGPVREWETLRVAAGSHFTILLLTQSGMGLHLAGQDLAAHGYIASVAGTDFSNAALTGATFSGLHDKSLAGCNFSNADLSGARVDGCRDLNKATWSGANLTGTDLSRVDPAGTPGVNFSHANLTHATLADRRYDGAKFVAAHLDGARLTNASFRGADFTSAVLKNANLDHADLSGAVLTGADFTGASLKGTNLTGAHLGGAKFDRCDLSETNFGATPDFGRTAATRTSFRGAVNLPATKLGIDWSFLDLTEAKLTAVPQDLSNLTAKSTLFPNEVPFSGITLRNAYLENARLYYAFLDRADLGGAKIDGALLKGATLTDANLEETSLNQAWLIAENHTPDPNKLEAAKLSGAFLVNTVLDGAHCDGADFSGVLFVTDSARSARPASAVGAFMNRANFTDANVIQVDFRGTQFSGAHFDNATLVASTFPSARLTPTSDEVHSVPTMHRTDIRGTVFADLENGRVTNPANMDGLEMQDAVFSVAAGKFEKEFKDFHGKSLPLYVSLGPTVLGTTTTATTCPNGDHGPCQIP